MKVFITGGNGFIGREFKKHSFLDVTSISRGELFSLEKMNLHHSDDSVLINFAFDSKYIDNFKIIESCFLFAKKNNIRRIVFLGSIVEYDRFNSDYVDELSCFSPFYDIYTQEKIECTRLIEKLSLKDDLDIALLQPTIVLGGGSWEIFFNKALNSNKIYLPDRDLPCFYIRVEDLIAQIFNIISCDSFGKDKVNKYILTDSQNKTWEDVFKDYGVDNVCYDGFYGLYSPGKLKNFIYFIYYQTPLGVFANKLLKFYFKKKNDGEVLNKNGKEKEEKLPKDEFYFNGSARLEALLRSQVSNEKIQVFLRSAD